MVAHLSFSGYLQPPSVPPDPVGDSWRGPTGFAGPPGPAGPPGSALGASDLPTNPSGLPSGSLWNNGGVVMVVT